MIILLTGTYGIGKTTLSSSLKGCLVLDSDTDKNWLSKALQIHKEKTVVVALSHGVSAALDEIDEHDRIGYFIEETISTIEERLISRGGTLTDSVIARQERLRKIADKYRLVSGNYDYVNKNIQFDILRREVALKMPDIKNLIYKATSPSGKVYIGQTTKKLKIRVKDHFYGAFIENKTNLFSKAMRKYKDEIKWEILEMLDDNSKLDEREIYWIKSYNSCDCNFGYNGTNGGKNNYKNTSELSRKTLKEHNKDMSWRTPEVRAKIAASNKGKEFSEEFRQKISEKTKGEKNGMFGKTHSKEALEKMVGRETKSEVVELIRSRGKSYTGDRNPFHGKTHDSETNARISAATSKGEVIDDKGNSYPSVFAASKALGIAESAVNKKISTGEFTRKLAVKPKVIDDKENVYNSLFEAAKAVGRSDVWIKTRIRDGIWRYG
jgi:group I intron endonuclease